MSELHRIKTEFENSLKAIAASQSEFFRDLGEKADLEIAHQKRIADYWQAKAKPPSPAATPPANIESDRPKQIDVTQLTEDELFQMSSAERSAIIKQLTAS